MTTEITTIAPFDDVEQTIFDALNMVQSGVGNPEQWLVDALGGGSRSASGAVVNYDVVLGIPSANRSINMIAGHLASMPKCVRQRLSSGGSEPLPQQPATVVTDTFCNDLQSCFTMWQTMMSHTLLLGNGRAFIARDGNGAPISMTPLMPDNTYTIVIDGSKYHVTYFTSDQYNDVVSPSLAAALQPWAQSSANSVSGGTGHQYQIPDEHVFHTPGIGYNGMWGYPLTVLAKDTFGVNLSGLDAVSYQFNNGGRPGLVITAPKGMFRTEKAALEWYSNYVSKHGGTSNAGRTAFLTEGMTVDTIEAAAADKGLKDLREMSSDDISLLFGTEYMLGESSSVYKDLPDRFTAYVTNTLNPWMEIIEQEAERKLLTRSQVRRGLYFHMEPAALLRGSPSSLAEYTSSLRTQGLISGNEGREMHGLNPVPELQDDYGNPYTQTNEDSNDDTTETEETEETDSEAMDAEARLSNALRYNFVCLIRTESRRVVDILAKDCKPNQKLKELGKFYDKFTAQLANACNELGVNDDRASRYVEKSQAAIMEVLGVTATDMAADCIKDLVSDWETRTGEFTDD